MDRTRNKKLESQDDLAYLTGEHGAKEREKQIKTSGSQDSRSTDIQVLGAGLSDDELAGLAAGEW